MVHFIFTRRHARHALALLTGQIQPQYQAARVLPSFRGPMHVPVHGEVSEEVDQEDSPRGGGDQPEELLPFSTGADGLMRLVHADRLPRFTGDSNAV